DGLAIGSGFVYRGTLMPQLVGKYVFTDVAMGRLFYADLAEMMATRGGPHDKQAKIHELQVIYNSAIPGTPPGAQKWRMFDIVAETFLSKGGQKSKNCRLPDGSSSN